MGVGGREESAASLPGPVCFGWDNELSELTCPVGHYLN